MHGQDANTFRPPYTVYVVIVEDLEKRDAFQDTVEKSRARWCSDDVSWECVAELPGGD